MSDRDNPSPFGLDRFGVMLSGLCAVHCVASLVALSLLGISAGFLLNPAIHRIGLAVAVLVGVVTIGAGALRHGDRRPLALGIAGLSLMATALFTGHGPQEAVLTISGVALLASGHVINLRRRSC